MSGQKHKRKAVPATKNPRLEAFSFGNVANSQDVVGVQPSVNTVPVLSQPSVNISSDSTVQLPEGVNCAQSVLLKKPKGLEALLMNDSVTRAEILWCLFTVRHHNSKNTSGKAVKLFPMMFTDSQIASKMKLQRTKIAYTIVFGMAPYFSRELQNACNDSSYIVLGFDESLNKVA